jgi:hypothetical protein
MDMLVNTSSEADRLVSMIDDDNPFELAQDELLPRQIAAVNERFQDRIEQIKLLQNRAEEGNISEVRELSDIVPLLFAHTTYKSYPENWLLESRWDRLGKWLNTVSTYRVPSLDTSAVNGLDEWLGLLVEHGHYVSCSSGTTGKCAMMNASAADLEFAGKALLQNVVWTGLAPNHDRKMISMGQVASTPKNVATGRPMVEAFSRPGEMPFAPNVPPITIGGITEMVILRKKIADGTAQPSDLAYYEEQARMREEAVESAVQQAAEALIENRHDRLHLMGLYGPLYRVAEVVRSKGFSSKDFQENSLFISGGLKRAQVHEDYKQIINETFNLSQDRICQAYGMQELNSNGVRCSAGRYHMAPWVVLLLLDESGEHLIEQPASGEVEGRAAFFDLSLDGRWGGVISGDKVRATWEPCACGNRSPSIHEDIQRYADTAGGDKIACSGTIDAYVRGVT